MCGSRTSRGLFQFFFNDTATTEIYTLSLHDALPISKSSVSAAVAVRPESMLEPQCIGTQKVFSRQSRKMSVVPTQRPADRKSTRLNSSHANISYAVFCLKKKNLRWRNAVPYIDTAHL